MNPIQRLLAKIANLYPAKVVAEFGAALIRKAATHFPVGMSTLYEFECVGPDGRVKWRDQFTNLVVDTGLDDLLNNQFLGTNYTASFFVGLTDGAPTVAAGDTMASHAGWAEVSDYAEATRAALTLGAVANQSVSNASNRASFSIDTDDTTIGGAFVTTDNTKDGAAGTLYGVGAFTGADKSADDGDTLNVTVTLTAVAA